MYHLCNLKEYRKLKLKKKIFSGWTVIAHLNTHGIVHLNIYLKFLEIA